MRIDQFYNRGLTYSDINIDKRCINTMSPSHSLVINGEFMYGTHFEIRRLFETNGLAVPTWCDFKKK